MNELSKTTFTPSLIINCLVQDFKEERLIKILIDEKMSIRQFKLKVSFVSYTVFLEFIPTHMQFTPPSIFQHFFFLIVV